MGCLAIVLGRIREIAAPREQMKTIKMPTPDRIYALIPALNEEKSIGFVLKDIRRDSIGHVVVIDNGSADRTSEIAAISGAHVVLERERGYGSACLAGLSVLPNDTEIVVFLDADYSDFPEEAATLVRPILEDRADLVIGTRMLDPKARAALTPQQRCGNRLAVRLMHFFWGCNYTDLGPFRAIRWSSLVGLHMNDRNFGWTVEMQIKAALIGLRTLEVPIRYRARIGRSKVSGTMQGVILAGCKILYTIFRYAWLTRKDRRNIQKLL